MRSGQRNIGSISRGRSQNKHSTTCSDDDRCARHRCRPRNRQGDRT
jgi:hypothetical protein